MDSAKPALGILVGGGPAPGINGVIGAATIEACKNGLRVIGFKEGFSHLTAGDETQFQELTIPDVSRIHFRGGSILMTSRANPTKSETAMQNCLKVLRHHNVRYLVTIGGDDTAFSASKLYEKSGGALAVAHVPKTIDNDLPLPPSIPTFGYETARSVGVEVVRNLMADAQTAPRWYLVVAMGRSAGHLALGIGKAAGVPATLIPEEFADRPTTVKEICDVLEGAILKRRASGRMHGVAVLAEGLVESMAESEVALLTEGQDVPRDDHGHIQLEDVELGRAIRDILRERLAKRKLKATIHNKNLGYELRCADPIPFDIEYTRDLGFGAVRFLLEGRTGAVITVQGGVMKPLYFSGKGDDRIDPITKQPKEEIERNPQTGRFRTRKVDIAGESYQVARSYMMRLDSNDRQPDKLAQLAKAANCTPEDFLEQFGYLMAQHH